MMSILERIGEQFVGPFFLEFVYPQNRHSTHAVMLVDSGLLEYSAQIFTREGHKTGVRLQSYIRFSRFRQSREMRTCRLTQPREDLGSQQTYLGTRVVNELIAECLVLRAEPAPVGISGFPITPPITGVEQGLEVDQSSRVVQFEQLAHGAPALAHISVCEASGVLLQHGNHPIDEPDP